MDDEPIACTVLKCVAVKETIEWCEKYHCPFAWQRRRDADRAERAEKDRRRQPQTPVNPEGDAPCRSEWK